MTFLGAVKLQEFQFVNCSFSYMGMTFPRAVKLQKIQFVNSSFSRETYKPNKPTKFNQTRNSYDPERERILQLRQADGLLQRVLYRNLFEFRNLSLGHNLLLLKGHRDRTTVARITVTFEFTTKFMISTGLKQYNKVMPLIAIRTINELNAIFQRSGTLIKLYTGCIKISKIWGDAPDQSAREVLDLYSDPSK